MAYLPNPFDHTGTLDTSGYGSGGQTETFGATGPVTDSGQPTAGARSSAVPPSAADICAAVDQDAVAATVATNRTAYNALVARRTRHSLAN
jgi:hypothetical protein